MKYATDGFNDEKLFDPFEMPPADFFEGLHLSVELMRDNCIDDAAIMADPKIGSGRAYVFGATDRMRRLLEADGWRDLPAAEGVGLPNGLMFIEDPVALPPAAPLTLAHLVAKHYVDELRIIFKRTDGIFFPRAVARQPDSWVHGEDGRAIVGRIIEDQYRWIGDRTPLIVAGWLLSCTCHEVARLNPRRLAAGQAELAVPSIGTFRRRLKELNLRHGWLGGRNPGFVRRDDDFHIV